MIIIFEIGKLAVIYKIELFYNYEKYIFIGSTFDLSKEQKNIIKDLENQKHSNELLQIIFNKISENSKKNNEPLGVSIQFNTLQGLRPEYYPNNVLPFVMEQLKRSFISTIYDDLKAQGKEYLLVNTYDKYKINRELVI